MSTTRRLELKKIEDHYEQLRRELVKEIGRFPDESALSLKPVETALTWEVSEAECQNRARANSLALQALELEVELAQIALERARLGPVLPVEIQELKNNLQLTKVRLEEAEWELESSVRQQYAALRQQAENLALNQVHLAAVRANFEKVQKQYEVGLLKEVDRLAAEAELLQAEYQMISAITNYQLKNGVPTNAGYGPGGVNDYEKAKTWFSPAFCSWLFSWSGPSRDGGRGTGSLERASPGVWSIARPF